MASGGSDQHRWGPRRGRGVIAHAPNIYLSTAMHPGVTGTGAVLVYVMLETQDMTATARLFPFRKPAKYGSAHCWWCVTCDVPVDAAKAITAKCQGCGAGPASANIIHFDSKRERPRCGARCRDGHSCRAPAVWDKERDRPRNGRCRMHGGLSTGPTTWEGRLRALSNLKQFRSSALAQ